MSRRRRVLPPDETAATVERAQLALAEIAARRQAETAEQARTANSSERASTCTEQSAGVGCACDPGAHFTKGADRTPCHRRTPLPRRCVPPGRAWLDVPYPEKDETKALGARWAPKVKRWYDPAPPTSGLARWAALPEFPDLPSGENRTFGRGLFVDLVPRTCWFINVRRCVTRRGRDLPPTATA